MVHISWRDLEYVRVFKNWGFPDGTEVKNPPANAEMQDTQFRFLGQEDPLE